jgi:hypothetical protein
LTAEQLEWAERYVQRIERHTNSEVVWWEITYSLPSGSINHYVASGPLDNAIAGAMSAQTRRAQTPADAVSRPLTTDY